MAPPNGRASRASSGAPRAPNPRQAVAIPNPASPRPHVSSLNGSSTRPAAVTTTFSSPATPSAPSAGRQCSTSRSIPATASGAFSTGPGMVIPEDRTRPERGQRCGDHEGPRPQRLREQQPAQRRARRPRPRPRWSPAARWRGPGRRRPARAARPRSPGRSACPQHREGGGEHAESDAVRRHRGRRGDQERPAAAPRSPAPAGPGGRGRRASRPPTTAATYGAIRAAPATPTIRAPCGPSPYWSQTSTSSSGQGSPDGRPQLHAYAASSRPAPDGRSRGSQSPDDRRGSGAKPLNPTVE